MVSVCIATHNGEEYIESQISSILPQLRENDEIIVSDDGSKDRTLDIVNAFKDKRIKVHILKSEPVLKKHSNFYNATKNFENAIKNANGDFIFLCDQDDIWYNNKIEICLK